MSLRTIIHSETPSPKAILRYLVRHLILSVGLLALVGCSSDRYELSKNDLGQTVRLDKQTGEIKIIIGNQLIPVIEQTDQKNNVDSKAIKKHWPPVTIPEFGMDSVYLITDNPFGRYSNYELLIKWSTDNSENIPKFDYIQVDLYTFRGVYCDNFEMGRDDFKDIYVHPEDTLPTGCIAMGSLSLDSYCDSIINVRIRAVDFDEEQFEQFMRNFFEDS